MATDDKIEETIKAIAARHGIALGRDDPILILQTINERLMQDNRNYQTLEAAAHPGYRGEQSALHRWLVPGLPQWAILEFPEVQPGQ